MITLTFIRLVFKAAANLSTQLSIIPSTCQRYMFDCLTAVVEQKRIKHIRKSQDFFYYYFSLSVLGTFADIHGPSGATPVPMPPYWTEALCFVCSGLKQWSGRKLDLTDHPWVMMMRGLLLLKPQEARVCSCRGSSGQLSSPSANILKTVLLTCGSMPLAAVSWSRAVTSREEDKRWRSFLLCSPRLCEFKVRREVTNDSEKVHKTLSLYVWSHYQRLNKPRVWVTQTSPLSRQNQVDLCQALPTSHPLSYINFSYWHDSNNMKHKGPTGKLNESPPAELEHHITTKGLPSILVQHGSGVVSDTIFPHTLRCLLTSTSYYAAKKQRTRFEIDYSNYCVPNWDLTSNLNKTQLVFNTSWIYPKKKCQLRLR